jgi:hypothetical protein
MRASVRFVCVFLALLVLSCSGLPLSGQVQTRFRSLTVPWCRRVLPLAGQDSRSPAYSAPTSPA